MSRRLEINLLIAVLLGLAFSYLAGLPAQWLLTYDLSGWGQFLFGLAGFIAYLVLTVGTEESSRALPKFAPQIPS